MVAAGVTAGSAPAATQQAVRLTLRYACAFPAGSRAVTAQVTATFPAAAAVGKPIQPTGSKITVTLPRSAVIGLASLHARAVTLTAGLSTGVTEGTRSATAHWRDFRSPAAAILRRGSLKFTTSGAAAPVTASSPGQVTVSASRLSLLLTAAIVSGGPADPSGTPKTSGIPGRPASIRAGCVPRAGQDTTLARIAVTGTIAGRPNAHQAAKPKYCVPFPKHLKLNPRFPLPKPLPGSKITHAPVHGCSYAAGYTNAAKLKEAALVGPGLTDLKLGLTTAAKFAKAYTFLQQDVAAQLEYHGRAVLPPARATLLGFGFTPVSATLQISEVGSLNAAFITCSPNPPGKCPKSAKIRALFFGRVNLRISHVAVNGVRLNVGPHCQTVSPFNLELVGVPPTYNPGTLEGILTGFVTIPTFKGCADGADNLNPIFDATVSGPGNFVKINQAPFCTPINHFQCPPKKAKPVH
jgi:hypothetical protein